MKKYGWLAVIILVLICGCCCRTSQVRVQSLRKTQAVLNASNVPEPLDWPETEPGESKILPRAHSYAPPQIPHRVTDMSINFDDNTCLDCHEKEAAGDEMPSMPDSHYTTTEGILQKTYYKGRHYCNQCHVPQVNAAPLVENTF